MMAGLKGTIRSIGRTRLAVSLLGCLLLIAGLAILLPSPATSSGEQSVEAAKLKQLGKSLIIEIRTKREVNLRKLRRRPDFVAADQRSLCVEMTRRGSRPMSRICFGGPTRTYRALGVSMTDKGGVVSSSKVIAATVKKVDGTKLVATFNPREAGLQPGQYSWRVADRASGCPEDGKPDKKTLDRCQSLFPVDSPANYELRRMVAVGCTGGNGQFVRYGPRNRKRVALTFDDGPSTYTPGVLRVLKRHKVKATFFLLGQNVAANPSLARQVLAQGHEVANHSYSHPLLPDGSNIRHATRTIRETTGFRPCLFRPPYGAVSRKLKQDVKSDRMKIVNWDVDTDDWRQPGSGSIKSTIINRSRAGSIVLMHDGGGPRSGTVNALDSAIRGLRSRGFELVTVTELLGNRMIYRLER